MIVGFATTVTVEFSVALLQPKLDPVTVYTCVVGVFATTVDPVVNGAINNAVGAHVYELALLATTLTVLPAQTLGLVTVIVGFGIMITEYVAVLVQGPLEPVNNTDPINAGGAGMNEMSG
jgi:hypothetical protein